MANSGESLDKISLAAALAQSYARDQLGFAGMVAVMLESSLPTHTQVTRKPVRLFSSEKRVTSVKINLGDEIYELTDPGNGQNLTARRSKIVRGITLKNDDLRLDQWLAELDRAVNEVAHGNEFASAAIADFLRERGMGGL